MRVLILGAASHGGTVELNARLASAVSSAVSRLSKYTTSRVTMYSLSVMASPQRAGQITPEIKKIGAPQ